MIYRLLADFIVLVHFAFVLFVILGGLLVLRWRRLVWLHLPAVLWGALVEFADWYCPLTIWEDWCRARGAQVGYHTDFVQHYLLAVLYPDSLTRGLEIFLGTTVLVLNAAIYAGIVRRMVRSRK